MKRVTPLLIAVLLAATFLPRVLADMYTVHRHGGTIAPAKSEDISMDAEDVRIEPQEYGYKVSATFVMRNHADRRIDSLVAFPVLGSTLARSSDLEKDFHVHIKSAGDPDSAFHPAPVELKPGKPRTSKESHFTTDPPKIIGDYPEAVVWNVSWAPKETKVVRIEFDMGEPMFLPGSNHLVAGWQWMYVVTTGSLWKGPIGRADISIKAGHPLVSSAPLPPFRLVSHPDNATWQDDKLVTWHFENWIPTEEIWLLTVEWRGLDEKQVPHYRFFLPVYRGAEQAYDDATIEELVARDLQLATDYLPDEARTFDRNLLRIAIADWLLHEIYARHGDAFYLGKESESFQTKLSHYEMDGHLYSGWSDLFRGYGYKGGWYKPDYSPAGGVKTSSLHRMEQTNVAFLRAYLDRLGNLPAYQTLREQAHLPGTETPAAPP